MIFGKYINRYYLKYGPLLLLGILTLIAVDYLQLIIPNLYQMVINGVNDGFVVIDGVPVTFDTAFLLDRICMPMLTVILCIVAGRFLWRICFFSSGHLTANGLRNQMFDHAKNLSQEYYQVNKVGDLMSYFTNDLDTVQECFAWGLLQLFDAIFLGGLAVAKMWRMDAFLTVLTAIPMVLLFTMAKIVSYHMEKRWDYRQECYSKMSDFSQESFSGIAVIKAYVKEAVELMAFKKLNEENEKAHLSYTKVSVLMRILVTAFVESVTCIILVYGGWLVHEGRFNAGQLMEFIGYFTATTWPIMALAELFDMTARGKASYKRIAELLDAQVNVKDREGVEDLTQVRGDIEFRDLTFRYPDGEFNVLENVSFAIHAGENIGLVGRTGSGKTTLVDLILRTYNVPDGTVFIDGKDVNSVSIRSVRDNCAYVPQDNFLFSDTIENNIAFAAGRKDKEAARHAAELADIHGNIMEFSKNYDTVLGERGVTVSGGQKQRISIARALMKEAPILILDDSVSAVDTKTEKTILENLRATRAGKTTILIAHRISTIEQMDKILFIEGGRVAAFGTHEQLLESCKEYRKMVELQKLEEGGQSHD